MVYWFRYWLVWNMHTRWQEKNILPRKPFISPQKISGTGRLLTFPFKSWPLLGGHSLVFFGGVVSKSLRTLPSLDIRFPSTGGFTTCHVWTRHYILQLGCEHLFFASGVERGIWLNKNPKSFGKKPKWIVGISQPIWESGIVLQMHRQTWGIQTLFGDADWKRRLQSASKSTRLGTSRHVQHKICSVSNVGVMQVTLKIVLYNENVDLLCMPCSPKPLKHNKITSKKGFFTRYLFFEDLVKGSKFQWDTSSPIQVRDILSSRWIIPAGFPVEIPVMPRNVGVTVGLTFDFTCWGWSKLMW